MFEFIFGPKKDRNTQSFTIPLPQNYRGVEDLRDKGARGKYVNQGFADTSVDGSTLEGEGFTDCSALIIKNSSTKKAYMAHIIKHGLTDQQAETLGRLPPGRYEATVVTGRRSRENSSSLSHSLNTHPAINSKALQIDIKPDIRVDADRFGVSFNPIKSILKIVKREDKKIQKIPLK